MLELVGVGRRIVTGKVSGREKGEGPRREGRRKKVRKRARIEKGAVDTRNDREDDETHTRVER